MSAADFILPAAARGYKQAGRRLLPRDSYDAARLSMAGERTMRALRRSDAAEVAAMGYPVRPRIPKRIEKAAHRAYESGARASHRAARRMVSQALADEAAQAERDHYGVW